jgi:gamma-glutamylcyclotransferase
VSRFLYFAYGSNMLAERLRAKTRCSSATPVGVGAAENFSVRFTKRSRDGSGKAALVSQQGAVTYGVLYSVEASECVSLDAAEGHGYEPVTNFTVAEFATGKILEARTYAGLPEYLDDALSPYDWYHALVIAGATHNGLPPEYIDALREIGLMADPDKARATRLEALEVLRQAGYGKLF